jgi:hypothetical protein
MADISPPAGDGTLARRLRDALARLAARDDLDPDVRARLHRQFIAVCDATKRPGVAAAACEQRLDAFLAALDGEIARKSGYEH